MAHEAQISIRGNLGTYDSIEEWRKAEGLNPPQAPAHVYGLPAEYRETVATLYADEGRADVRQQIERHVKRFHIKDVDKLIERLRAQKPTLNNVLLLTYLKSEFAGLILKPDKTIDEDKYQGKVGLVIALGPLAFKDDERTTFGGLTVKVGDFVVFRQSDGLRLAIDNAHCRLIPDNLIQQITTDPESIDMIY